MDREKKNKKHLQDHNKENNHRHDECDPCDFHENKEQDHEFNRHSHEHHSQDGQAKEEHEHSHSHDCNHMHKAINDLEQCIENVSNEEVKKDLTHLKHKLNKILHATKNRMKASKGHFKLQGKEFCCSADECVRKNPWASVAVGATIGMLIGTLLGRRY